jgi:ribosomal-protein-alanine N-acetyltransferase
MDHPFVVGEKLYLRALERSDINEDYLHWINDAEVTKYMLTGTFPSNVEKLEEYYHRMTTSPNHVILAIVDKNSDRHVGNITLNDISWIDRTANLGIMIGDKDFWGKGYGTEATKLMIQYAFGRLNLRKLWLGVYASQKAAIRLYEKAGFKVEGCLKSELYRDGKYHDRIVMGITVDK